MNKGIGKALGEYCLFLNSGDCLVNNSVLEKVFEFDFDEDVVYGNMNLIGKGVKISKVYTDEWTLRKFFDETLPHPASFIKRKLFFEIFPYNESYKIISDWEFFVVAIIIHQKTYRHVPVFVTDFLLGGMSSTSELTEIEKRQVIETHLLSLLPDVVLEFQRELNKYRKSRLINLYDKLLGNKMLLRIYNFMAPKKQLR
jgi:hypothetical protein